MSNLDKKLGVPSLPSVNLIPQEIAEATKMRAVKVTALLAVVIAVGVVVAGFVLALGAKQLAKSNLDDAVNAQTQTIADRDSRKSVYDAYQEQERLAWTLGQIGYGDIDVASLTYSISELATDDYGFSRVIFRGPSAVALGPVSAGAAGSPGVGSIEFQARATSPSAATEMMAAMEALPGIEDVIAVSEGYVIEDVTYWSVEGTATVTEVAFSGRFLDDESNITVDPEAGLAGEDGAPEPSPAPSPEPSASSEGDA